MLGENSEETFDRTEECTVDHYRTLTRTICCCNNGDLWGSDPGCYLSQSERSAVAVAESAPVSRKMR